MVYRWWLLMWFIYGVLYTSVICLRLETTKKYFFDNDKDKTY